MMSAVEHVEALRRKHAHLEKVIEEESVRPHPDEGRLHELKREKLRLKDQIIALAGDSRH